MTHLKLENKIFCMGSRQAVNPDLAAALAGIDSPGWGVGGGGDFA